MFDGPWETCMLVRGLNPSECASWVQAWGTILAIVASAAVIFLAQRFEARRQRKSKSQEEVRMLRIVGQFVFEVRAKLRDIEEHDIPHLHRNWTAIDEPVACLRAIAFEGYPDERPAFSIAAALVSYRFLRDASEKLGDSAGTLEQADHVDASRRHALAGFFRAERDIEEALAKRGSGLPRIQIDFESGVSIRTLDADPL